MDTSKNQDEAAVDSTVQPQPQEEVQEDGHRGGEGVNGAAKQEGEGTAEKKEKKPFQFPSTFAILLGLTIVVAILTWIIPAGLYKVVDGKTQPNTYHQVPANPQGVGDILLAPINGMYGIESAPGPLLPEDTASAVGTTISVYNEGALYGSIGVALFVLVIGAFITMTMRSGAIAAGIGAVTRGLKGREALLIPALMLIFAAGGTTYGMGEETLGFYPIIIALMLGLGYDTMTAIGTIALGAGLGVIASTVNPFATGIASDAAGISIGEGIVLRLVMLVVLVAIGIFFVMRYARRVKANPSRSVVADLRERHRREFLGGQAEQGAFPTLTNRHKWILAVFGIAFLIMIYSVIPWSDFGITWLPTLGWWFGELAALFMLGAIVIGLIAGFKDQELVTNFVDGAKDFILPALIIAVARGITVIMHNGLITDTILHSMEGVVAGRSSAGFGVLMYIVNLPLAFLIPSSSAHATLAMPILAPLADFAKVSRAIVVTSFQSASGLLNLISPTSVIIMGALAVARVGYDRWLRFVWPLLVAVLVVSLLAVAVGAVVTPV